MLIRYFVLFAFAVRFLAGQALSHPEPNEAEFRGAVQRWSEGLKAEGMKRADSRAEVFAIAHEEIAIPILVNAVKVKLRDKHTVNDKWKKEFMWEMVALITYNGSRRAVDAVADLCSVDQESCPWMVKMVLNGGSVREHPSETAYDIVERYANLRKLVLPWIEENTTKSSLMARKFARELLKREKAGHPISETDVIILGLSPTTRKIIDQAVLTERIEENQRRKK